MNGWKLILGGTVLVLLGVLIGRSLNQPDPSPPMMEPEPPSPAVEAAPVADQPPRGEAFPGLPEAESHPRARAMVREQRQPGTPPGLEEAAASLLAYVEEPTWDGWRRLQRPGSRTVDPGWLSAARRVLPEGAPDTGDLAVLELVYIQAIGLHEGAGNVPAVDAVEVTSGRWTSPAEFTSQPDVSGLPPSGAISTSVEVFNSRADLQRVLDSDGEVHHANIRVLLPGGEGFAVRLYYAPTAGQWLILRAEGRGMELPPL